MRRKLVHLPGLLLTLALASPATADHFDIQTVVLENGGGLPGGGTVSSLARARGVTAAGELLVVADVWDGVDSNFKAFLFGGAGNRVVLEAGEPAPGGGSWSDFEPVASLSGDLGFTGVVDFASFGAWKREAGGDSIIALPGGAAPLLGATWLPTLAVQSFSNSGTAVFFGGYTAPGGDGEGWFLDTSGGQQVVAVDGDPAPGGGTFTDLRYNAADAIDDDSVVFRANVTGGTTTEGIYRWDAGVVTPLVVAGDAVATPGGGTFEEFGWPIAANESGAVVFRADILRGASPARPALFILESGTLTEVLYFGDPVPGSSGLHFSGAWDLAINASSQLAFTAPLQESPWAGLFFWDGSRTVPVLLESTPHPEIGGREFYQFGNRLEIDDGGRIVFDAGSTDLAAWGLFTARAVEVVPALPGGTGWILPLALAAVAAARLRRP